MSQFNDVPEPNEFASASLLAHPLTNDARGRVNIGLARFARGHQISPSGGIARRQTSIGREARKLGLVRFGTDLHIS